MAEHFVAAPRWEWYILGYFFLGGLAGGMYALATMLRLWGSPRDEAAARTGFLAAFPLLVLCPILLTIDLGRPVRFWHMLVDTTPGHGGLAFKYWSPMSVGSWALLVYGAFALVSFIEVRALDGRTRAPLARAIAHALAGGAGRAVNVVVASLVPPLVGMGGPAVQVASGSGSAAVARAAGASRTPMVASVLLGVLLMRFVVIWSAQF